MPTYQYYEIFPDGSEGEPFDVSQKINEPTLGSSNNRIQ